LQVAPGGIGNLLVRGIHKNRPLCYAIDPIRKGILRPCAIVDLILLCSSRFGVVVAIESGASFVKFALPGDSLRVIIGNF
jgi:hypothetical protein